jgi:hypothetical protein
MTDLYVIALTDEKVTPPRAVGRKVEVMAAGGIYAVVQKLSERPVPSEDALRQQHDLVVRIAKRSSAILPARFGSLVAREELEKVLTLRRDELARSFDLVRHREQMTVRVFGDAPEAAPTVAPPVSRPPSGTQYLRARREATAGQPLPAPVKDLIALVRPFVRAERVEAGHERVHATVYHLIDRGRSSEYRGAVQSLLVADESRTIRVTGPWPPFAFTPELWP